MNAFFTAVLAFLIGIVEWLTKKFGVSKIVLAVQITVITLYSAFVITALTYFIDFLMTLWTLFNQLINDINTFGVSVSGTSYGISNSQIVTSFWGFIHASGLDDAIMTSSGLFIGFLATFFAIQVYKIVRFAYKELYTMLVDLIKTTLI